MALKRLNEIDGELAKLGPMPSEDEMAELVSRYGGGGRDADELGADLAVLAAGLPLTDES